MILRVIANPWWDYSPLPHGHQGNPGGHEVILRVHAPYGCLASFLGRGEACCQISQDVIDVLKAH